MEIIRNLEAGNGTALQRVARFLELIKNAPIAYKNAEPGEKRELVKELFSNLRLVDKNLTVALKPGVELLANRKKNEDGSLSQGIHRTWNRLLNELLALSTTELVEAEVTA